MKKNNLKLTNLEMRSIKGGAGDSSIRPVVCWFCGCGGEPRKQSLAFGKKYINIKK